MGFMVDSLAGRRFRLLTVSLCAGVLTAGAPGIDLRPGILCTAITAIVAWHFGNRRSGIPSSALARVMRVIGVVLGLCVPELPVFAGVVGRELVVAAGLDDASVVEYGDPVAEPA